MYPIFLFIVTLCHFEKYILMGHCQLKSLIEKTNARHADRLAARLCGSVSVFDSVPGRNANAVLKSLFYKR